MIRTPALALVLFLAACGDDSSGAGGGGGSSASSTGASAPTTGTPSSQTSGGDGDGDGDGDGGSSASSTSGDGGSVASSTAGGTGGGAVSPGCGNAAAPAGEAVRHLTIDGTDRSFIVMAPDAIDPDAPLSLVFVFHGNGGNGEGMKGMGIQNAPGARENAVFVFPDGLPFKGFGVGWNGYCDGYDMELFDTMIATLSADYCVDPARIFAAGFSWGGDMCQSLACCRGEVVRAIAPASGPELYPSGECQGSGRPAFRMTYADNDAYPPEMFDERIEFYRTEHGCSETSTPIEPSPCIAYDGCDEPVIACEYAGLGHAWPADYGVETWSFFSQFL